MERFAHLSVNWCFSASIGSFQGLPAGTSEVILLSQRLALKYNTTPRQSCQHFLTSFFQILCGGVNSLSQSLTALPAPSEREPLAKPEVLHLSRKLSRYAKGPIPEGAVAVGDWGSSGKRPFCLAASRQATFPKGTAFCPGSGCKS